MPVVKAVMTLAALMAVKPFARAFKGVTPVAYECPTGAKHVEVIRTLLNAGAKPQAVLCGYVIARLPAFSATEANKGRELEEQVRLLIKHGRTHLHLAMAVLNPASVEEQVDKATKAVEAAKRALDAAEARQTVAKQAQANAAKAKQAVAKQAVAAKTA